MNKLGSWLIEKVEIAMHCNLRPPNVAPSFSALITRPYQV